MKLLLEKPLTYFLSLSALRYGLISHLRIIGHNTIRACKGKVADFFRIINRPILQGNIILVSIIDHFAVAEIDEIIKG